MFSLSLRLNKETYDQRWKDYEDKEWKTQKHETIVLEFEDTQEMGYYSKRKYLQIVTRHIEVLPVDKRAVYLMAVEVATAIDGQISEDNKKTWLSPEEFIIKHEKILDLTYSELNEQSLKEIEKIDFIEELYWKVDYEEEELIPKSILENAVRLKEYLYQSLDRYFCGDMDWHDFAWDFSAVFHDEDSNFQALSNQEYVIMATINAIIERDVEAWGCLQSWFIENHNFRTNEAVKRTRQLYQDLKALREIPRFSKKFDESKKRKEEPRVELKTLMKTFRKNFEGIFGKFPQGTKAHQDEAGNVSFSLLIYNTKVTFRINFQNRLDILVDEHGKARSLWYFMRSGDAKRTSYIQDKGIYLGDEEVVKQTLEILKKYLYDTMSFGF